MPSDRIPKAAIKWIPTGKNKRSQPKNNWRRKVMKELEELGLTWGEAQANTKDRVERRRLIGDLCPSQDEEVE